MPTHTTPSHPPAPGDHIAAIDAGSNAIRFSIFKLDIHLTPHPHVRKRYPIRLGAGTFSTGALAPADIDAAIDAFREIVAVAREHNVIAITAVATSAIREASNADEFLARVKAETGITLRAITGAEEARLACLGIGAAPDSKRDIDTVLIDIGGGSTEVALFNPAVEMIWDKSLPIGAVRLAHQWGQKDHYDNDDLINHRRRIEQILIDHLPANSDLHQARAVALGGTPAALLTIAAHTSREIRDKTFPLPDLNTLRTQIASTPIRAMPANFGIDPRRASIILPGAEILIAIMHHLQIEKVTATEAGVREGLAKDYILSPGKRP